MLEPFELDFVFDHAVFDFGNSLIMAGDNCDKRNRKYHYDRNRSCHGTSLQIYHDFTYIIAKTGKINQPNIFLFECAYLHSGLSIRLKFVIVYLNKMCTYWTESNMNKKRRHLVGLSAEAGLGLPHVIIQN